jgi:hypothetical protein
MASEKVVVACLFLFRRHIRLLNGDDLMDLAELPCSFQPIEESAQNLPVNFVGISFTLLTVLNGLFDNN